MKKPGFVYKIVLFILSVLLSFNVIFAQDRTSQDLRAIVESADFVFEADQMLPAGGASRTLIGEGYDVRLSKDSVSALLPYFGRAFSVAYGTTDGGIRLNTKDFDYKAKRRKKGGWTITIEPKDADIRQMYFTVHENGFATLNVNSNNRQSIAYTGRVVKRK